ncbi:MAG TPA: hypothetical protein DCQ31_07015 [Bacteroidales bacterium]|nr:hypothetical protein [Bacteroidales bacterium]
MKLKIITALIISVLVISCNNKTEQNAEQDSSFVEISKAQFEAEKMTIGEPELYPFADKVHFTGVIIPAIDGYAKINLPFPGIIDNIRCKPSQMINKGSVLFEISGYWFIDLQKDFSESSAILSKLKSDYQRAKELFNENISTQKDLTAAESSYFAENAKHMALKTKLESMGLDVAKIEKGEFYRSFPIKSPINGYVSNITASLGQYIEPQQTIAEIIDNNSFQLKLHIFDKDIDQITIGQTVEFYLNANKAQKYSAAINAIGKTIMPESKSIECFATINKPENVHLVSNQFVEGEIFVTLDSVLAVPETAIINSENEQYILLFEKEENDTLYFSKIVVNTGRKANNYIELTEQKILKKILLTGTYNIVIE